MSCKQIITTLMIVAGLCKAIGPAVLFGIALIALAAIQPKIIVNRD